MAFIPNNNSNLGMFVPTTVIYDAQRMQQADVNSKEFKELIVRLYQTINTISLALNAREIGHYPLEEFVTGNLYYNPSSAAVSDLRPIFRTTYDTGPVIAGPNPGIPHGLSITSSWQPVHIYGVAWDSANTVSYPMPNADIAVYIDATNIVITNWSGVVFDVSSIVLEYSKT